MPTKCLGANVSFVGVTGHITEIQLLSDIVKHCRLEIILKYAWGLPYMASTKCLDSERWFTYTIKFMQTSFLSLPFNAPPSPTSTDVIYGSPLCPLPIHSWWWWITQSPRSYFLKSLWANLCFRENKIIFLTALMAQTPYPWPSCCPRCHTNCSRWVRWQIASKNLISPLQRRISFDLNVAAKFHTVSR